MSVNPVFAALVGLVALDQHLDAQAWIAVVVIVSADAVAVTVPPPGNPADTRERDPADTAR